MRDLENIISTACITATGDFIDLSDLPEHLQHRTSRLPVDDDWQPLSLAEVRKLHRFSASAAPVSIVTGSAMGAA